MSQINPLRELVERRKREAEFLDEIASNWERLEIWEEFTRNNPDILPRTVTLYGGGFIEPAAPIQSVSSPKDADAATLAEIAELERENAQLKADKKLAAVRSKRSVGHLRIAIESLYRLSYEGTKSVLINLLEREPQMRLIGHVAFTRVISKILTCGFAARDGMARLTITPVGVARAHYYAALPAHRTAVSAHQGSYDPTTVVDEPQPVIPLRDIQIDKNIPLPGSTVIAANGRPVIQLTKPGITEDAVLDLLPAGFKELKTFFVEGGFNADTLLPAIQSLRNSNSIYQDGAGVIHVQRKQSSPHERQATLGPV